MKNNSQDYLLLLIKGFAIGVANVIPGLSGATVAAVTGVYEKITESVAAVNTRSFKVLLHEGGKPFVKALNAKTMLAVTIGVFLGFFLTYTIFEEVIENYPALMYSLVFGIVGASAFYTSKNVKHWDIANITSCAVGFVISYLMTLIAPIGGFNLHILAFLSGLFIGGGVFVPSVSSTFLFFYFVTDSGIPLSFLHQPLVLVAFVLGACSGVILAAQLVHWMFVHAKNITYSLITGCVAGGWFLLWPWKDIVSLRGVERNAIPRIINADNILPFGSVSSANHVPEFILSIVMIVCGVALIMIISKIAKH